jgi:hypothetical protein
MNSKFAQIQDKIVQAANNGGLLCWFGILTPDFDCESHLPLLA